jgi:hypothetical protein
MSIYLISTITRLNYTSHLINKENYYLINRRDYFFYCILSYNAQWGYSLFSSPFIKALTSFANALF